jgi:hypothetical protein
MLAPNLTHDPTLIGHLLVAAADSAAAPSRCPDRAGIFPIVAAISLKEGPRLAPNALEVQRELRMDVMRINLRMVALWVFTGLFAALMLVSAIPDVLELPAAIAVFRHLGYPQYLLPFLGTAKLLGVAVVVTPGVNGLKEWAFAGLTFDLMGALYSHLSVGDPPGVWMAALIGLVLMAAAYWSLRLVNATPAHGASW